MMIPISQKVEASPFGTIEWVWEFVLIGNFGTLICFLPLLQINCRFS